MEVRATLPCVVEVGAIGSIFMEGRGRQGIHIERGVKSVLVTCLCVVNCYQNYFFFTMGLLYLRFFRIQSPFMFCILTVVRPRFVLMRYHTFGPLERCHY